MEKTENKSLLFTMVFGIFGILVAFYGILFSLHQDAYIDALDILLLPYKRILGDYDRGYHFESLKPIRGASNVGNRDAGADILHIFVLDISESMAGEVESFFWYDRSVEKMIKEGLLDKTRNRKGKKITLYEAARVRLAEIMFNFYKDTGDSFAVWSLGDQANILFPKSSKGTSPLFKYYIRESMKDIPRTRKPVDKNTDFSHLLKEIKETYGEYINRDILSTRSPMVVLTILSDMLHDIRNKHDGYNDGELRDNWDNLKDQIMKISNRSVMANMIITSRDGKIIDTEFPNHFQIMPSFNKNFEWHRLKQHAIGDRAKRLFVPVSVEEPLVLYFENANTGVINDVNIKFGKDDKISAYVPSEVNSSQQDFRLTTRVLGSEGEVRKEEIISSKGHEFTYPARKSQILQLKFNEDIPTSVGNYTLLVDSISDKRTYMFNIEFRKILPFGISLLFIFLQFSMLYLLAKLMIDLRREKLSFEEDSLRDEEEGLLREKVIKKLLEDIKRGDSGRKLIQDEEKLLELMEEDLLLVGKWIGGFEELEFSEDEKVIQTMNSSIDGKSLVGNYKTENGFLYIVGLPNFSRFPMRYRVVSNTLVIELEGKKLKYIRPM
uniref:Uncharacterized protein n=1 Tax=Candidatus Kentrum sp. FM TaxID=2126340 RepID=A0A450RY53_9GAMM|nr:MAG: hypothetical protein BECKFM1743C_GA0114222_100089 [Candidatus Kentron sp. FM]VFJ46365.1 MAG: hypothetical protein BECKFM1743A_GA0114220_100365 [Candidatus Kentron sp. FM]VFK07500.1 MAG: hypothetical protein BECKFM1743B_GA0114221_100423 [Candidatus Kentron sp. FM]